MTTHDSRFQSIWADVQANHAKLESCSLHKFGPPDKKIGGHRTCKNCGGWVNSVTAQWYETGLRHGRQQPTS